jgi:transposase InsO family protein
MPWEETNAMTQRARFCALDDEGLFTMTELCQRFRIARKTGYKWRERWRRGGAAALADGSRAPHSCPHRTPDSVVAALLSAKEQHPSWGPKKIHAWVQRRQPQRPWPAVSTIGDLFARHQLTQPRPRRARRPTHPGAPPLQPTAPNQVWCADFKGEFPTLDGQWCYPFTVTDAYSRVVLACEALPSTRLEGVLPVCAALFAAAGLPWAIRTDNGSPFASQGVTGLTRLSVWWAQLGIVHQRIAPGCPQQNGRHERFHRTLKAETARPPAADLTAQQQRFARFCAEFNAERPHEALAGNPPASCYQPSPRPLPARVLPPEYPGHFLRRRVSSHGSIRFHSAAIFLCHALAQEVVGLVEVEEGVWSVHFYDLLLGRFTADQLQLRG